MFEDLPELGSGSGSSLPFPVLLIAGLSTVAATAVSTTSILLHLKNYRKPILQRMVVRIMLMVPIYAISSFVSLFSLQAAFFIDVVRDIYEAFVIYCFFDLLIAYLGGERSLLILLHGRPPKYPIFPTSLFWREVDVSDPYTFLFLKRGVIQYVQIKPILAVVTIILKLVGKYNDGDLRANSGYLYVSIVYNGSICLSLYCLAIFWMCVNEDLKPFRPMPKFLCVKGILFFSFWQSIGISILVAAGAITKLGPYADSEHISLGLTDTLICLEMPIFAVAHMFAFSTQDFIDPHTSFVARMPVYYAFRDAFGVKDVVEDVKATLRGEGMDYREFEPSEGFIHQGAGRDRRIRAGLRYSQGGKHKYWLPQPAPSSRPAGPMERRINKTVERVAGRDQGEEVYAPLLSGQAADVVHIADDLRSPPTEGLTLFDGEPLEDEGFGLPFGDIDEADELLFRYSKKYLFGDYHYPCLDVSSEAARRFMWDEEERILRDERGAFFSPLSRPGRILGQDKRVYGAVDSFQRGEVRESTTSNVSNAQRKGKSRADTVPPRREVVIDREHDQLPEANLGEVRLRWTTSKEHTPSYSPRLREISASHSPATTSPSNVNSPATQHPSPSPRKETERPVLPPDAVDLIVEDSHAAEQDLTHERRRGEPTARGAGLHKVYRRGYVVDGDDGTRKEVEVEPRRDMVHGVGPASVFDVGDDGDSIVGEEEVVNHLPIARAETPPPHARAVQYSPEILDSENPWA